MENRAESASPKHDRAHHLDRNSSLLGRVLAGFFVLLYRLILVLLRFIFPLKIRAFFHHLFSAIVRGPYTAYTAFNALPLHIRITVASITGLISLSEIEDPGSLPRPLDIAHTVLGLSTAFLVVLAVVVVGDFIATRVWPWDKMEERVWGRMWDRWMWGYGEEEGSFVELVDEGRRDADGQSQSQEPYGASLGEDFVHVADGDSELVGSGALPLSPRSLGDGMLGEALSATTLIRQ